MITDKELNAVKLSPTKKDFYQIWGELLDTAGKISERWDPTSTNESDPGIVLLKVLTAVADKLNYNIDVNTLEAFMPSAAQEESMRKLTEMLGYNMKYYQSATTEVKISYTKNTEAPIEGILVIDKFTNIKDVDDSINYVTLEPLNLTAEIPFGNIACMEGELVECETADNNIVSIFHLDDNKRYFLPETQIAENSIFITNIENNIEGTEWRKVSNLNAQSLGSKIFKFGFDSQEGLPYIQFPDDISTIIEDGLRIKYIRTSGASGNISVNTLTKLSTPVSWSALTAENKKLYHDAANFSVTNIRAASNGADKEGINAAYNNFKKTIGTFDTLVTCRDYMNKIYQLVSSVDNTTPLVSNVIVSDIKSDINRAVTLGTFTSRGVEYKVIAKKDEEGKDKITHFDLFLYPFKSTYGLNSRQEFIKSFKYDNSNYHEILTDLEDTKTLAHNIASPEDSDVVCIKNYYHLRAKINTVRKVGAIEQASILNNVYKKLFETFNMRQLDFGEEIPYDTLLKVIETADFRIKNVSLDEPSLTTKFMTANNVEVDASDLAGKKIYNSLVLNNVLAGRVPLFNYNTDFSTNFTEKAYSAEPNYETVYPVKTGGVVSETNEIHKIKTEFEIPITALKNENTLKLTEQEVIQFKAPSLKTTVTYPAYVNYYFIRNKTNTEYVQAIPATMQTLGDFLKGGPEASAEQTKKAIEYYINETNFPNDLIGELAISSDVRSNQGKFEAAFNSIIKGTDNGYGFAIFIKSSRYEYVSDSAAGWNLINSHPGIKFYALRFDKNLTGDAKVSKWVTWIKSLSSACLDSTDRDYNINTKYRVESIKINGFYLFASGGSSGYVGYLVDQDGLQFKRVETYKQIAADPFTYYYVPRIWNTTVPKTSTAPAEAQDWHTQDGLGQKGQLFELPKGIEYELTEDEYLLINWTQSKEGNDEEKEEQNKVYGKGTIIKPNFLLVDSEDWHSENHSYTKLNVKGKFEAFSNLPGMFTLGTNEQIEIREIITVTLDDAHTNLYWDLPDRVSTAGGYVEFPFDEEPVYIHKTTKELWTEADGINNREIRYLSYTLKEGEYLYYTDMNKSDIAFYGFGTTIKRGLKTPTIFKYTSDDLISTDEISTNGLSSSIPWRSYKLNGSDAALTIIENQFINLTEGDTLVSVDLEDEQLINNDYKNVGSDGATWKIAGSDSTISLPTLKLLDENYKWQVRSKLNLSMGPNNPQTLKTKAVSGAESDFVRDKITLINTSGTGLDRKDEELITICASAIDKPLSIKANKLLQSATTVTDVTDKKIDSEGNLEYIIANLQIKLFETESIENNKGQIINFGNYGDGNFTTVNFEEQLKQAMASEDTVLNFKLNMLIPENNFGLLMLYYQNLNTATAAQNSHPILTASSNVLSFFNESVEPVKTLTLRPGINVISIKESTTVELATVKYIESSGAGDNEVANNKVVLTFGTLDLIPISNSINPKLCYKVISPDDYNNVYEQILADIKTIDINNEFYYNIPVEQTLDLDLNPNDDRDNLENPLNWFNYNNINNKFVIAQIDTESLPNDIIIAKSSRSNF